MLLAKSKLYELNLFRKESRKESIKENNLEYSLKFCKYKLSLNLQKNEIMRYAIRNPEWNDILNIGNTIYALYSNSYAVLTYYIFKLKEKAVGKYYYEDKEKNLDKEFYLPNNFFKRGLDLLLHHDVRYTYEFGDSVITNIHHGVYDD